MNRELEIRERVAQYGMALLGADRVEMDATRDNLEFYAYSDLRYLLDETDRLTADLAAMTAERDAFKARAAAVEDLRRYAAFTSTCKKFHVDRCGFGCLSPRCPGWEWRGPDASKEATP